MTYFPTGALPNTTVISDLLVLRHAFTAGAGGSLVIRRSDSGVAGEVVIFLIKI